MSTAGIGCNSTHLIYHIYNIHDIHTEINCNFTMKCPNRKCVSMNALYQYEDIISGSSAETIHRMGRSWGYATANYRLEKNKEK